MAITEDFQMWIYLYFARDTKAKTENELDANENGNNMIILIHKKYYRKSKHTIKNYFFYKNKKSYL